MDFPEIIDRLKNRNINALASLFTTYGGALNGIILRILSSEKLAEKALQNTFLKVWEEIDQYDAAKSTLFTWMSQIARHSALELKHEHADENLQSIESLNKEIDKLNSKSSFNSLKSNELIEKLDDNHRLIIDYIYLRGYSQTQTAEALKIAPDMVKSKLRFALLELIKLSKDLKNLTLNVIVLIIPLIKYLCL
jgi:RNA polymerase sigma-70 factor (ECF subfamily)